MELPETLVDPSVEHVEIPDEVVESVEPKSEPPSREKLEQKVSAGLKSVFNDEEAGDDVSAEVEKDSADETKTDEAADDLKETVEEADKDTPSDTSNQASTLPASYVRSLKAYGWDDAEIAEAAKHPTFLQTATKIHNTRSKELAEFAAAGRQAREANKTPAATPATAPAASSTGLNPIDIAALKKEYGGEADALIDKITGPVNQVIERINGILPQIQASQQISKNAETESIGRQIESFFTSKELESYKPVFGTMTEGLKDNHLESRNKVLEFADALMTGARAHGRQMSLDDALKAAFDSVASGFKEQAVRTTIKKQMKQRERGISLRPGSPAKQVDGKVRSRAELEKKVASGLRAVFHNS